MPFHHDFDPVYHAVEASATSAVPDNVIECNWLKDVHAAGRITDDIVDALQHSALCIADVTGNNPNVMWETGFAMALGKPTILIGQEVSSIPFDLKVHRVLSYSTESLPDLSDRLAEAIRQTLARYTITPLKPVPQAPDAVIAVTGTMNADDLRVRRRIETLLTPYLNGTVTWYCGTYGAVDQATIDFLLQHDQRVVAVGYHQYDLWPYGHELVRDGRLHFLDASVESLPKGIDAPSQRDILFATKADLVVIFWDGDSPGTKKVLQFYETQGKNLLLGFI